jgi:hypothetical protein
MMFSFTRSGSRYTAGRQTCGAREAATLAGNGLASGGVSGLEVRGSGGDDHWALRGSPAPIREEGITQPEQQRM